TPITLKSFLPDELDVAGMPLQKYLARLCAEAITIINAPDFARDIVRLADCRHLISIGTELVETACNAPFEADTTTIASYAIDNLDALATARAVTYTPRVSIGDAASEAIQRMSAVRVAGGGLTGI